MSVSNSNSSWNVSKGGNTILGTEMVVDGNATRKITWFKILSCK